MSAVTIAPFIMLIAAVEGQNLVARSGKAEGVVIEGRFRPALIFHVVDCEDRS